MPKEEISKEIVAEVTMCKVTPDAVTETNDTVIREYSLEIKVNGSALITLLCLHQKLDYLAAGYLLSQGVITTREDITSIKVEAGESRGTVSILLDEKIDMNTISSTSKTVASSGGREIAYRKNITANSSTDEPKVSLRIKRAYITELMHQFVNKSKIFRGTGGVHSAALADDSGILLFCEDIGRHNAIDKILGESLLTGISVEDKILITSGRVSSEIVSKIVRGKVPVIVSKSAVTDIAIKIAKSTGINLIGFTRGDRMSIFTDSAGIE